MPANVDGMVREGVSAYRAGRKEEARALLMRAVEIDQYNEQAWLWLSAVVESVDEQRTCLENVLTINPGNERAKQGMQMLNQKAGASKAPPSGQADDVLASTSFGPPSASKTDPFSTEPDEEVPTSIEWDAPPTATSSPSSAARVNEPSKQEYDDWVSNLNLGGASSSAAPTGLQADAEKFIALPTDDDEDDDLFDFDSALGISDDASDDLFASGPFSEPSTPVPASPKPDVRSKTPLPPSRTSPSQTGMKAADPLLDDLDDIDDDDVGEDSAFAEDFDETEMEKLEASEFFRYIPKEITPTRLPGTHERIPVLVILGFIVMIALNVGAVAFLVMKMTSTG